MGFWAWAAVIAIPIVVSIVVGILVGRAVARASHLPTLLEGGGVAKKPRPCYRCGEAEAVDEFMGLHYCLRCRMMVARMYGVVQHDPPFGFPGAPGYTEYPMQGPPIEEKKEA